MTARPFPWASLPRASRSTSAEALALRAALGPRSVVGRALEALSSLAGTPVVIASESTGAALSSTLASGALVFRVAPPAALGDPPSWWVVSEVEATLAVELVARVMRRPPPRVVAPGLPSLNVVGAFAAVLAAALRRAGAPVMVSEVGSSCAVGDACVATFTVVVGELAGHLRALFPSGMLALVDRTFDRDDLASLGALPLDLPIVACRIVVTAAEIAAVAEGDAWLVGDGWPLGSRSATPSGPVWLCAPSSERALVATLEADGRVVLRDGIQELGWSPMEQENDEGAWVAEAVGEVPVVVRVEVGMARMKAKDWSALAAGDVVGLGSKVGGPVVLRVSGMAVAEGELVDLDGEVGVRIRKLLGGSSR